jgi:hypothetical protein
MRLRVRRNAPNRLRRTRFSLAVTFWTAHAHTKCEATVVDSFFSFKNITTRDSALANGHRPMPTVLDPDAEAPAQAEVAERQPLLTASSSSSYGRDELEASKPVPPPIPPSIITRLCVSHFLSAWNSRLFEFGSVLFIASIYPGTLLPVSVYALVRAAAAIILSPTIGVIIDKVDRLVVVRASIVGERVAIGVSCAVFLILKGREDEERGVYHGLFAVTVVLAGVEKLCAIMNSVSVKRDWVR